MCQNHFQHPQVFRELLLSGCLSETNLHHTADGFFMADQSVAAMRLAKKIPSLPDSNGTEQPVRLFYDDWYLFTVPQENICGLLKMREQEYDALDSLPADGDTPGVTLPFIAFSVQLLLSCLRDPTPDNKAVLQAELHRVTAAKGQIHHNALKDYFISPKAEAPYLIAELFCKKVASFARDGFVPVSVRYSQLLEENAIIGSARRLSRFLNENNAAAGYPVCNHEKIYIQDPLNLSRHEQLAILATHTGNVSFHSFAAEVVYHARFLAPIARIPVPFIGWSVFASAIRADMSIAASSLEQFAPFYHLGSRLVRQQENYHRNH